MVDDRLSIEQFRETAFATFSLEYPSKERLHEVLAGLQNVFPVSDDVVARCIEDIELTQGVSMELGSILEADDFAPWLETSRSSIDPYYWDRYRKLLIQTGRLSREVASQLDEVTDRILGHCGNPSSTETWDRRGMVVGHVQSGKTSNYTGLICKAADAGYRFIVVIAGVHNSLRNQTQERIDEGFIGRDNSKLQAADGAEKWVGVGKINKKRQPSSYTSSIKDFSKSTASSVGNPLANSNEPVVFVIKKNSTTLRNLLEWLRQNNTTTGTEKIDMPMLLIDDEADNASINVAHGRGEVSKINGQLRDLLKLFARSSYVGYTATPFANIFVEPDTDDEMLGADLFPRDFIVSLDPPSNYSGPNRIFQDPDSQYLNTIEDAEPFLPLQHKIDWEVSALPPSMVDAIRAFIVARAIRLLRGHETAHMSMLLNASRFTRIQGAIHREVHRQVRDLEASIRVEHAKPEASALKNPELRQLHRVWLEQYSDAGATWPEVQSRLLDAVASIKVITVNSASKDALEYSKYASSGLSVIAVGGYALSRGLTLEGLMVSYFYRRSLMYDTLLQMGRWFGYRPGYDDLCRIWMTEEAEGWYEHITESVDLLREEFRLMDRAGASPREFGLKVRSHPDSLTITARNKIGFGQMIPVQIGLGNSMIETSVLQRDERQIVANQRLAASLVQAIEQQPEVWATGVDTARGLLFRGVKAESVIDFVAAYKNCDRSIHTQPSAVSKYISDRSDTTLAKWDVLFVSLREEAPDNLEYAELGLPVIPQKRATGPASTEDMIFVTAKQRVASRGIERIGVDSAMASAAEREFDANAQKSKGAGKTANYPDYIYRAKREFPLLMIHVLRMDMSNAPRCPQLDRPVVAWGISFPRPDGLEPRVEYLVNTTWIKENVLSDVDEEDMAGDEY